MGGEWRKVQLGNVVQNFDSLRIPLSRRERKKRPGPYPYYGATGIMDYVDDYLFDGLYLLIAEDGSVERPDGKPFLQLVNGRFWVNNHAHVLRGETDEDTRFIYYALSTVAIRPYMSGSVQAKLNQHNLNRIHIHYPADRKERRAIARILGTLDDKIELNRRMNETLEAMAQALFKSWFVDFDPVVVNALKAGNPVPEKFAEHAAHYRENPGALGLSEETLRLFPDRFVDSELGPIPAGWRASKVGDEFDITMGQSPPGSTYNEIGHGLPFFQGRRDFGFRYPTNRVYCTAPKRVVNAGDTLVSVRAPVGDINMAYETCAIGRGVAAVRHKSGSRSYTYYAMRALGELFRRYEAGGTVFGAINKKQFHDLPNIAPKHNLVSLFEDEMYPFDAKIRSFEEQSRTLAALRDTLLPKLISGEVRVPDAEKILEEAL